MTSPSTSYYRAKQLTKQKEEIQALEDELKEKDDFAYQLFIKGNSFNPANEKQMKILARYERHLLRYFEVPQDDIRRHLQENLTAQSHEYQKRRRQRKQFQESIAEIQSQIDSLQDPPQLPDMSEGFDELNTQYSLSRCKTELTQFRLDFNGMKLMIRRYIESVRDNIRTELESRKKKAQQQFYEHQSQIVQLEKELQIAELKTDDAEVAAKKQQLKAKREELQKLEDSQRNRIQDEMAAFEDERRRKEQEDAANEQKVRQSISDLNDQIETERRKQDQYDSIDTGFTKESVDNASRRLRAQYRRTFDQPHFADDRIPPSYIKLFADLDSRIAAFVLRLDALIAKANGHTIRIKAINARRMEASPSNSMRLRISVLSSLLHTALQQHILTTFVQKMEKSLTTEIEKMKHLLAVEQETAARGIGDTGLTFCGMAREVRKLEKLIGANNVDGLEYIRSNEEQMAALRAEHAALMKSDLL